MSTRQTNGLWTMTKGEFEESVFALEKAIVKQGGNPRDLFNLFRTDGEYAGRIAQAMMRKGLVGSIESRMARMVLGRNIFDVADWMSYYDAKFTKKQLRDAGKFPWGEDVLNSTCPLCGKTVKDCHFAFLGLDHLNGKPLTILKLQELHSITAQPRFYSYTPDAWYSREKFVTDITMDLRWYLLHTNIVPKSEGKTFDEQKAMLPAEYEVPSAITEVSKDLLVFKKTGVYANLSRYGRCTDVDSDGDRVSVGHFFAVGLHVGDYWDVSRVDILGVSASRKF